MFLENSIPLKDFKFLHVEGCKERFTAKLYTNFGSEDELNDFIDKYNDKKNETLRLFGKNGEFKEHIIRRYYRCQHNTQNEITKYSFSVLTARPFKRLKNTNCPFTLSLKTKHQNYIINSTSITSCVDFLNYFPDVVCKVKGYFKKGLLLGAA